MNIRFDYNVVEDTVVVIKIKNSKLQDIALTQNFRNDLIKKNVFNKNIKILIKRNITRAVTDRN